MATSNKGNEARALREAEPQSWDVKETKMADLDNAKYTKPSDSKILVDELRRTLPSILWRSQWREYRLRYGVPFQARSLANYNVLNIGPPAHRLGSRVFYRRDEFLAWLESR